MKRILILDDNPDMLSMLADLLRLVSYEVNEARNGEEGLQSVRQSLPDLILTDARMPVMDGWEFMRRLRADPVYAAIPCIIFSGDAGDRDRAFRAGADAFITKPFRQTDLEDMIAELIARSDQ
jgi:CheY-like chemotaxis protein